MRELIDLGLAVQDLTVLAGDSLVKDRDFQVAFGDFLVVLLVLMCNFAIKSRASSRNCAAFKLDSDSGATTMHGSVPILWVDAYWSIPQ